jgi:hypothetical protein
MIKIGFCFERSCWDSHLPNVVVEWLTLLLHICEVPGSNLGQDTGYPTEIFHDFPQSLQANSGIVP